MPRYLTIGYGDRTGYDRTPPDVREAAHEHDAALLAAGAQVGIAGRPVQVRNAAGAGVETAAGQFLQAALPVAGFALLEADSLEDAVEIASRTPCAVAHGVVEVWPLDDPLRPT